jgi:hypothetical protein
MPLQPGYIRVLRPVIEVNGDITWTMHAIQLGKEEHSDDKPFDALSYVWGDQSHTSPFICNDQEFRIHRNLRNALPYLAKRDSPRPIWIDALSINQRDEDEKAVQIKLMHRVYRRAAQVWIWFGCATEQTPEAISFLPRLNYALKAISMAMNFIRPTFQSMGLPDSRDPLWKEVIEIVCNDWFGRLWVLQEAALAKQVRVLRGTHQIEWDMLTDLTLTSGLVQLALFRDDPQAGIRTSARSNRETNPETEPSNFLVDGLSAFLRNDRSALSSYDLLSHLPLLQSESVYKLIEWAPGFLPEDMRPLWRTYIASKGNDLDSFADDLLSFLMPGRERRRTPWSEHSFSMPDRLPTTSWSWGAPPRNLLGNPSTSTPEIASLSFSDSQPLSVQDNSPICVSDDPPISVPDDPPISMPDDPPISVPDYLPVSERNDLRDSIQKGLWSFTIDGMYSSTSQDRMAAFTQDIVQSLQETGVSDVPAVLNDLLVPPASLSDLMQMEMDLGLGLDAGRLMRTTNLVMTAEMGRLGRDFHKTQNQASDEPSVALLVLEIVWMTMSSQACFDPRDRVFATFGFLGEALPPEFSLSHKMGLDELYATFCQYLLAESVSSLNRGFRGHWWPTLHRATLPEKRSSLPSWCPDFHQKVGDRAKPYDGTISSYGNSCQPRFKAGRDRPIVMGKGLDWSQIRLGGRVFDLVLATYPTISVAPDIQEISSGLMKPESLQMTIYRLAVWEEDLAAQVLKSAVGSIELSTMFEAYWQTLIGDQLPDCSPSLTRQCFLDFQTGLRRVRDLFDKVGVIGKRPEDGTLVEVIEGWEPSTPEEADIYHFMTSEESSPYFPIWETIHVRLSDNRPFTTKSGRFGYGRVSVKDGDVLCIFDGSTTAHLIRRKDKGRLGDKEYQLVGEAFVHGVMYGEIRDLDINEQDIILI